MHLSVIIVNYNVKYFLQQCLLSVQKAANNLQVEVIVVDNNSSDGSVEFIQQNFADIILITNNENIGFAAANNMGILIAKGKYILLLNPDTFIAEDTFKHCINFMDVNCDAGSVGVQMLDGKGLFLPESKRGLPTPFVAFCKIFGLSAIFPKSKTFNRYYLDYLPKNKIHEIDVLSGAFMFIKAEALHKIGGFDKQYFMYGEDIDLSYCIQQAGYKNYYYPYTQIIHYKGESTKKGSLNYVQMFYNAMIIFAKKHYSKKQAKGYAFFIHLSIYVRALIAVIMQIIKVIAVPISDAAIIYFGMYFIKTFWENNIKIATRTTYPIEYLLINVPIYIVIWILSIYLSGGYDKPFKTTRLIRGVLVGTVLISALYGFLPEMYRFSRAMIIAGAAYSLLALISWRLLKHFIRFKNFNIDDINTNRTLVVGDYLAFEKAQSILHKTQQKSDIIGFINNQTTPHLQYLGSIDELPNCVNLYHISEIVFCTNIISYKQIIQIMEQLNGNFTYKNFAPNTSWLIGSNSKNTAGDIYTTQTIFNLQQTRHLRNKRVFDLLITFFFILLLPVIIFLNKKNYTLLQFLPAILINKKTWVGYYNTLQNNTLPKIPPAIFLLNKSIPFIQNSESTQFRLNFLYAKDYSIYDDWEIWWKNIL